jgi:hypothetical protein
MHVHKTLLTQATKLNDVNGVLLLVLAPKTLTSEL